MKLIYFIQYAVRELAVIPHPTDSAQRERLDRMEHRVRTVDLILGAGTGRYQALRENFYEALSTYLTTPRHHKALIRGAIERLAVYFEGFLRVAVASYVSDRDVEMIAEDGQSRGKLSQQGYVQDILEQLCDLDARLSKSSDNYWNNRSVEETIYAVCFKHQQRGKHEARDYGLWELERLVAQILAAYLLFAGWMLDNTDISEDIRASVNIDPEGAIYFWPAILEQQLAQLRIGREDVDLQGELDRLRNWAAELRERAQELRDSELESDDPVVRDFVMSIQICNEEYEQLVSESNFRDWGREARYSEYI